MEDKFLNKDLQYQHEILCARLEVREYYLTTIVKEIYENIGQVLSLVRMELAVIDSDKNPLQAEKITSSSNLVGKAIRDLRKMCQAFYPDLEIANASSFIESVKRELEIQQLDDTGKRLKISGVPRPVSAERTLILFRILQEIFTLIKLYGKFSQIEMEYGEEKLLFIIKYLGTEIDFQKKHFHGNSISLSTLTIEEKAKFINADLSIYAGKSNDIGIVLGICLKSNQ